jgi:hypothetical protein
VQLSKCLWGACAGVRAGEQVLMGCVCRVRAVEQVLMGCVCRVRAGERVAMECAPYGDQPIRLSWLRNGQPVNPSLVKVSLLSTQN